MSADTVEIVVGRMRLTIPIVVDEETTLRVAEHVNARLDEIDKKSPRVDSLLTALTTAVSFAAELEAERLQAAEDNEQAAEEHAAEQREFFQALNKIANAIRQEETAER